MTLLSETSPVSASSPPVSSGPAGLLGRVGPAEPADPAAMPLERVEAELCTLAGQIAAATSRFLTLLADFDAREGWGGWGVHSCAHWLSWRCGLDLRTAQEHVRVARALRELPLTSAAFGQGRVSYSKARAISRVATADNEHDLVEAALHAPASQLERLLRGIATAKRNNDDEDRRRGNRGKRGNAGEGGTDDPDTGGDPEDGSRYGFSGAGTTTGH